MTNPDPQTKPGDTLDDICKTLAERCDKAARNRIGKGLTGGSDEVVDAIAAALKEELRGMVEAGHLLREHAVHAVGCCNQCATPSLRALIDQWDEALADAIRSDARRQALADATKGTET